VREAQFETMEDGRIYARISSCEGLWADGDTLPLAQEQLRSVLDDWILIKARHGDPFPAIAGYDNNPQPAYAEADQAERVDPPFSHPGLGRT
jgi:predicted RNase H-like HicB family nuclease